MLQDEARNQAYAKAIRLLAAASIDDDDSNIDNTAGVLRWLDIGTGSGLLASLVPAASTSSSASSGSAAPTTASVATAAAIATANVTNEVYACEGVKEVADVAAQTFEKNRVGVRLFRGRSTEMEVGRDLPSRVPRVISEILGTDLLGEGVLPTLRDAKARLLSPGYTSIPSKAEAWAFCCESSELHSMSRLLPSTANSSGESFRAPSSQKWEGCPGAAGPASMHESRVVQFRPLSPSVRIFEFDFTSRDHPLPGPEGRKRHVKFPIDATAGRDGAVHAIVCWWRCFMDEGRTIVMSTSPLPSPKAPAKVGAEAPGFAPPCRDHWRQSVYILTRPVKVEAGDVVCAHACHDDSTMWFETVVTSSESPVSGKSADDQGTKAGKTEPTSENSVDGREHSRVVEKGAAPLEGGGGGERQLLVREGLSQDTNIGSFPPVCVCGLHRTCPPFRIWMLNDQRRTAAFRVIIRAIILDSCRRHLAGGTEKQLKNHPVAGAAATATGAAGVKRRRTAAVCVACISDGFLLPLLAAQEGASEVLEIQPSTAYRAVCRDVYRANGIDVDKGDDCNDQRGVIRPFPGGISNVYELLVPPPGSASADSNTLGLAGKKLDAVIGEPFFADLSTAAWPLESLLLFWCARTALEAGGYFSPRTRVMPARARLLACPFACELLFRGRRRVGTVEGVDMTAVNDGLGLGRDDTGEGNHGADGGVDERRRPGEVESLRLSDFGHQLLGPPTVVLDMDLTRPLCDLRGSRTEIRCYGHNSRTAAAATGRPAAAPKDGRKSGSHATCHGIALWVEIWLDEEGLQRLSTGPEVPCWAQGLLFFEEGWVVPQSGRTFHLKAALVDGAFSVDVS